MRVSLPLCVATSFVRANTLAELHERAVLESCGILRGSSANGQIRPLVAELRTVEIQQLIVRQLRLATMPEGWASPSGGRVSNSDIYSVVIYMPCRYTE